MVQTYFPVFNFVPIFQMENTKTATNFITKTYKLICQEYD